MKGKVKSSNRDLKGEYQPKSDPVKEVSDIEGGEKCLKNNEYELEEKTTTT